MKKLLLFAVAATMFAACSKDTTEDINVLPDGILRVSFSEDDSRVQLDENSRTVWNEGDQISVFNKTDGNECWRFDGKTGDTVGTISRVSGSAGGSAIGKIFAVYPYAESNAVSADGTITTEIPATQKYCADSYGVGNNIMVASSESGDLAFKNALGWIKIRLSGTETVKSLVLEGNDGETLTGTATIDADLTVSLAADAAKSLTLDCGEGVALSSDPTAFYFAVVPQVFEKGISVTAHYSDGSTFKKSTDKTITVERNHIVPMAEIVSSVPNNQIWYTSANNEIIEPYATDVFGANIISNTYENGKGIITFDEEVKVIGNSVFDGCYNLTTISIPNSVTKIGTFAFSGCSNLKSIIIPDGITEIEDHAFFCCGSLTSVVIGNGVSEIGDYAFFCCGSLRSVVIGNGITTIGEAAFSECRDLTTFYGKFASEDNKCLIVDGNLVAFAPFGIEEYITPTTVTAIAPMAFYRNTELKRITISEGVTSINHSAFMCDPSDDTKLEYVYLPSTLTNIEPYIFARCKNIKKFEGNCPLITDDGYSLIIDNYLQHGRTYMVHFATGAGLTSYTIPEGVEGIENYCFYCAETLASLTLPKSLKNIGELAFDGSYNIEKIFGENVLNDNRSYVVDNRLLYVADKGIKEYTTPDCAEVLGCCIFSDKQYLETIVLSDNVRSTEKYGYIFCHSPKLKTIIISARMIDLGMDPFGASDYKGSGAGKCESLEEVYLRAPIPPAISYNWSEQIPTLYDNLKILVPQQSLDLYLNSSDWQPYRKYIVGYEYTDLPEPDYYISSDYSADGTVQTLQKATVGRGIDIILMGDAFSDRQIAAGDYDTAMRQAADNLFTEEPYKSFRNMFNVYAVTAVSATEGYEHENTAFSGYFGDGTIVGGNDAKAFEYAQKAIAAERMDDALIVVMMNSQAYAGTCYMYYPSSNSDYGRGVSVAYFPLGTDNDMFAQLLHHEACGHGFAKLADEYAYEYMGAVPTDYVSQVRNWQSDWGWYKNVDFTSDPATVKWHSFLSDPRYANEGLGVFEGGATYWTGVWRPTENSIMRYNTGGFNAPSREAIYYRIHKLAYGESWNYDYEDFVAYDAVNRKATAGISLSTPIVPKDFVPLAPPVVVGKSWRDAR